jgi:hypothetical protein
MAMWFAAGLIGAVGARTFISQHFSLRSQEAIIFNSIDMAVSALFYGMARKDEQHSTPNLKREIEVLLRSRVLGIMAGVLALKLNPWTTVDVPLAVFLNFSSLVASFALTHFFSPPVPPPSYQESVPSAPPASSESHHPLLPTYF